MALVQHALCLINTLMLQRVLADRPHELPADVREAIARFMRALGLVHGALDRILTPDGRYVFLEVIPERQFLWLEEITGLPLCAALAEVLWRGGVA